MNIDKYASIHQIKNNAQDIIPFSLEKAPHSLCIQPIQAAFQEELLLHEWDQCHSANSKKQIKIIKYKTPQS